jgi:hypothetical protein
MQRAAVAYPTYDCEGVAGVSDSEDKNGQAEHPRRTQAAFRAMIDEMLSQLRAASSNQIWTPESRASAEEDLARIMESVRREAISDLKKDS